MNLKNKITLNICILVTLSLIVMCFSLYAMSASILSEESNNLTEVQILRAQEKIDLQVEKIRLEVLAFSKDQMIRDFLEGNLETADLNRFLTSIMAELNQASDSNYYKDLFCVDLEGIITSSTMPNAMYVDLSSRSYIQDSIKKHTTETSDILNALTDSANIVNTTHPVYSKSGKMLGLFGIAIKAENFVDFIKDYTIGDSGYFSIIDSGGFILSHKDPELIGKSAIGVLPNFETISAGDLSSIYKYSTADYVYSYKKMEQNDWILSTVLPKGELAAKTMGLLKYVIVFGVIISGCAIFASIYYSNIISSPIVDITNYINSASSSNEMLGTAIDTTLKTAKDNLKSNDSSIQAIDGDSFIKELNERLENKASTFDRDAFALIKKAKTLTNSLEMKSYLTAQFLSTLSHDIRTSLTLIKGYSKGLMTGVVTDEEAKSRFIEEIYQSADTLEQISYDVLDSTYEAQYTKDAKKEPISAEEFCCSLYQTAKAYVENSGRVFEGSLDAIEGQLPINRVKIIRVWQNMLSNAIKYSEVGSKISVSIRQLEDSLQFRISDRGIGIKEEDQAYIFDMFYKGEPFQKESYGLGLFVSRLILDAHGSRMEFSSEPGVGSSFWFTLPLCSS